ncbi:MAG TPA: efflux RND transporter periplasmic adaptor subunit [Blastocatellia bacterium]|jgi:cobalt-zinc-cadmium efflux system membrane fusion protein
MKRLLLLGPIFVLLAGCESGQKAASAPAPTPQAEPGVVIIPPDSPKLAQIRIEPIKLEAMPAGEVTAPGKVEVNLNRISRVPLPVAGRVMKVLVKLGDGVAAGQPLLMLESPDANAATTTCRQSEAAVTQANATLSQANAALVKAQADYDRSSDLLEHGSIARKEVINADSALKQSKAAVELASAGVEQAKAARAQALKALDLLGIKPGDAKPQVVVRSPLAGKVLDIGIVAGEYRNDTTAPVLTIADLRTLWMTSDVPENAIRLVSIGESVNITLDAYPDQTVSGRVARVADTLDPKTRTIKVMVELDNARGRFKPEMFGRIRHLEAKRETPALPVGAIIQDGGKNIVYVEQSKGRFEQREIMIGNRVGDMVAILGGVNVGERVVVDGAMLLRI